MFGFLEYLPSAFVVLVLVSLLAITAGFLAESFGSNDEFGEPKPLSRPASAVWAALFLVLLGYWVNNLTGLLSDADRDWFMLVVCIVWIGLCLFEAYRHLRAAIIGDRTVDS